MTGEIKVFRGNPVHVTLCPLQLPRGLFWGWTRPSKVKGWQLTAWPTAWPGLWWKIFMC